MTDLATLTAWRQACEYAVEVDRATAQWNSGNSEHCFAISQAYQQRAELLQKLAAPESEAAFRLALIAYDLEYAADMCLRAQIIGEGTPQPYAFKRLDERERRRREYLNTFKP